MTDSLIKIEHFLQPVSTMMMKTILAVGLFSVICSCYSVDELYARFKVADTDRAVHIESYVSHLNCLRDEYNDLVRLGSRKRCDTVAFYHAILRPVIAFPSRVRNLDQGLRDKLRDEIASILFATQYHPGADYLSSLPQKYGLTLEDKIRIINQQVDPLITQAPARIDQMMAGIRSCIDQYVADFEATDWSAIHCDTIIKRASFWVFKDVPFSRTGLHTGPECGLQYSTDGAGYVSMAWRLPTSMTALTLGDVSRPVTKGDLQRGDILLKAEPAPHGHAVLFVKWVNATTKEEYYAYEAHRRRGAYYRYIDFYPYEGDDYDGYEPRRFKNVTCN